MGEAQRGCCQQCGKRVSIRRVLFGSEYSAFKCNECGTQLRKKTHAVVLGMAAASVAALADRTYGFGSWIPWATLLGALVVIGVIAMLIVRIEPA
jgi:hypothetical protein